MKNYLLSLHTKFQTYMKSINLSVVLFAILATIFVGCGKDKEEKLLNPTIEFTDGGAGFYTRDSEVDSGATIKVRIIAQKGKDGAKLKNFKITRQLGNASPNSMVDSVLTSATDETFNFNFQDVITISPTTYTFTITDKDGKSASKTIKFTIRQQQNPTITKPKSETNRTFNHKQSYDLEGLTARNGDSAPSNPSDYDLYYFNSSISGGNFVVAGKQNHQELTSNFQANWAGSNNVNIRTNSTINQTLYDQLKDQDQSQLATLYNNGTDVPQISGSSLGDGARVNNLAQGQFYVIRTSSGKYAVIKVTGVSQTQVSIDFLIQN